MKKFVLFCLLLLIVSFLSPANRLFAVGTGELRSYSTIHSIGIEWDLSGDTDHNSACQAKYRKKTTAQWTQALNLFMTLKPSCNAVDAGIILPNINDDFQGDGPDLGAYELGGSLPHYGPRSPNPFPWLLFLSSIRAQEELLKSTGTGDNEK